MGIVLRPLCRADMAAIGAQAAELAARPFLDDSVDISVLCDDPHARTLEVDGAPVVAGGFVDCGAGAAVTWGVFGRVPASRVMAVLGAYRGMLDAAPFAWIEAHVSDGLPSSARFLRLAGFTPIAGERVATPDGSTYQRFVYRKAN
jgi:hypothetical protein